MKASHPLIISAFLLGRCIAYPTQAGHCQSGPISQHTSSHGTDDRDRDLDKGNYFLNSNENGILVSGVESSLSTGVDHFISLNGEGSAKFRGFLFRLSGANGVDATGVMKITDASEPDSTDMTGCGSGSSGISHNKSSDKSTIDVVIRSDQPIDLVLEVTVVVKNGFGESNMWHYEKFDLKLEAPATASPTAPQPTASPTTAAPTMSMTPTTLDSSAPSAGTSSAWGFSAWTTLVSVTLATVAAAVIV